MFDGSGLASGMYLYRLQAGDFVQTKKDVGDNITQQYEVDCISGGGIPTAPPRIIIKVN